MLSRLHCTIPALTVMAALSASPALAVSPGQSDDFNDGTTEGWSTGGASPNPPVNVPNGGPDGAGDGFLELSSNGAFGPGGKLVAFNLSGWTGDFTNIPAISMDLDNLGDTDLVIRLILENGATSQALVTEDAATLRAHGDWQTFTFSLAVDRLSGGSYADVMGNVTTLTITHNPAGVNARSLTPNIAAQLGVDNISAVPEPRAAAMMIAGLLAFAVTARSRRHP
ncbi:MAG: hypothetical protein GC151_18415 [Betaproteobacteria bacterium]|nr:hypothetical protein [Betaproteobacteria bacterium]